MPPPESTPPTEKPTEKSKGDEEKRERSNRSRRQRKKSADRKKAEKGAETPTPRTGPMKSAEAWPRSEPSESVEPGQPRKLDLEQISPEKFRSEEASSSPEPRPKPRTRTYSDSVSREARGGDASSRKGSKVKKPKQTPDNKARRKDDKMNLEPSDRNLNAEAKLKEWKDMNQSERDERITELKLRRASMRAAGIEPSMFDYPPTYGPCASEPAEGSRSRKASTALSSRASREEVKEARDMRDLGEERQNPWENYRKVERLQHEQQVRTNELERRLDKKNKELEKEIENVRFFQKGGQRMIKQVTAQARAIEKQEIDKTYDMMGFPSDPEDWQIKEFAGKIMHAAGIKPHAVWNMVRKNYWEHSKHRYQATLRFHFRDVGCKKIIHKWFVQNKGKTYEDENGNKWDQFYVTGRWTQTRLVIEQGIILNANFNCLKSHLGVDLVHHDTLGAYKDDRLMCIRSKRTNYPIVQLAFDESVSEPSVTMYICTNTPEIDFDEFATKIEDWCLEEEENRLRKLDEREQAEEEKNTNPVPKAPSATAETMSPWNYWRRRYLPLEDLAIDFPKFAKDLAKNSEALTSKGTSKGQKGQKGNKGGEGKGREGKGKGEGKGEERETQDNPPKGALPKASGTGKGTEKGKAFSKGSKGKGRGNAWLAPQDEWYPQAWYPQAQETRDFRIYEPGFQGFPQGQGYPW